MKEDLLESIFGTESKMSRREFLQKLTSERNRWIMDSEEIRKKAKRYLRARSKGVSVLDQMADSPDVNKKGGNNRNSANVGSFKAREVPR